MKRIFRYLLPVFLVAMIINSCEKDPVEDDKTVKVTGVSLDMSEKELTPTDFFTLNATIVPSEATNQELIWACSNDKVVKIEEGANGTAKVIAVGVGNATIAVTTVDGNFSKFCSVTVIQKLVPVTGVTLEPNKVTLDKINKTVALTHTIIPADATNPAVEFTSSNPAVAKVDKNTGLVTAVGKGTAVITVTTSDGAHTAPCEVTVYVPITGVSLDTEEKDLFVGEEFNLTLTIEPDDADPDEIKWESDNKEVATVDENGKVKAIAEGIANIVVTVDGKSATCKVTVTKLRVTDVILNEQEKALGIGETFELKFTVLPEGFVYSEVEWESDDTSVVDVDQNGKLTAIDEGVANIKVTVDGVSAVCKVVVALKISVRREHRGAWITTVWDIDWPGTRNEAEQKQRFIDILNMYQAANFNSMYVQVRGMADPFWESQYESWSVRISGTAGQAPMYNVMQFMIDECHKRGMEFHAWLNPFRIATRTPAPLAGNPWPPVSDPKIPKEWVKDYPNVRVYNPAYPEVRQRLADIVEELITMYRDIDGIHFDDYFYPEVTENGVNYSTALLNDEEEFRQYGQGFITVAAWRRNNVDLMIQKIGDVVKRVNPKVVFSISPQGNESNNYNNLFADVLKWCQNHWIDMVIPQIYYTISSYTTTLNTWSDKYAPHVPCLVGYPIYRINTGSTQDVGFTTEVFDRMHELARAKSNILGGIYYNTVSFQANRGGAADVVRKYYAQPAVRPETLRKTEPMPDTPVNVTLTGNTISWSKPATGISSVVYLIPEDGSATRVFVVTRENSVTVTERGRYIVTALNQNNVESVPAKSVTLNH